MAKGETTEEEKGKYRNIERLEYFGKREKEEEKENKFKEIEHRNEILDPTNNHSPQTQQTICGSW